MTDTQGPQVKLGMRKIGAVGGFGAFVLVGLLGVWSATTMITGAVIAPGEAVVRGNVNVIQSLDGGIVDTIAVRNGDIVVAGQILMEMDPTRARASMQIARGRLAAALALKARLQAEQRGDTTLTFSYPELPFDRPDTSAEEAIQADIFDARADVRAGQIDQLEQTQTQYDTQRAGLAAQIAATRAQIELLDVDLRNQEQLAARDLARQSDLSQVRQVMAERSGHLATLQAEMARLTSASTGAELELLQAQRSFMEATVTELNTVGAQIEELILEIMTLNEQLARIAVRAPVAGIVHEVQITTVGGVAAPGATLMEIIPLSDGMDFELRLDPRRIDQVRVGQAARVMIASADPANRPELAARVRELSPGTLTDARTGQSYYRAVLEVSPEELARLDGNAIPPGMPVDAFLEVGERSVLAYLMHPITTHMQRAFRE